MGQVCFTTISSNRARPMVFIALSSVFQIQIQREGGGGDMAVTRLFCQR